MKSVKRLLSSVIALVVVIGCFITPISVSAEGANNRVKTFIRMAAGAEITNEDVSGLTVDQLQFLGVYLSNFYQPFGTEFGGQGSDDKIAQNCRTDMISALQTKLSFSDEMSNSLIDYILQMTRESIQYLDVYTKRDDGSYAKLGMQANYYNFVRSMLGDTDSVYRGFLNEDGSESPIGDNYTSAFKTLSAILNRRVTYTDGASSLGNVYWYDGSTYSEDSSLDSLPALSANTSLDKVSGLPTGVTLWAHDGADYLSSANVSDSTKNSALGNALGTFYSDPDVFIRALYIYVSNGYELSASLPYLRDNKDFSKTVSQNALSIGYYLHRVGGENKIYWSASGLGKSDVSLKEFGKESSEFQKIGSSTLVVDTAKWKECEDMAKQTLGNYMYFGYERDGETKIVYDCTTTTGLEKGINLTPSQQEFLKCLETVNVSNGYGINLLDFNSADAGEDGEWDENALKTLCDRLSDINSLNSNKEMSLKSTIWGQKMAVDCFGNIICMGANHQYVAVPACMNPYTWQAVDKNGEDMGNPGAFMNIINAKNLVQVDNGSIQSLLSGNYTDIIGSSIACDSSNLKHRVVKLNNYAKTTSGYNGIGVIMSSDEVKATDSVIPARLLRGQGDYVVKQHSGIPFVSDDVAKEAISNIVYAYSEMYPDDKSVINGDITESGFWWWSDEYVPLVTNANKMATSDGGGWLSSNSSVNILDGFVFIDNLGVYKNTDGTNHDYSAFNIEHYIGDDGVPAGSIANGINSGSDFGSNVESILSGKLNNLEGASAQSLSSIYVSYVYASFYNEDSKADTIGRLGYRFAKENLPKPPSSLMNLEIHSAIVDMELNSIRDWTYYLLHPTKGFDYVTTLVTNKVNHLLLGWHNDMVGTNGVGITTGTTRYRSNVGYVTMPDLSEIEWTAKLINFYQNCIPFLVVAIIVLMLFAFITGVLSLQRAIIAAVLFSSFLLLPTIIINGSVRQSNDISQRIYGEKFTYWAMVQQESYATQIDESANSPGSSGTSSYENYLRTLYGLNQQVYTNQGTESIVLKWQAPKKMASLVLSSADGKSLGGLGSIGSSMLNGMLGNSFGGQSYVDNEDAVYMYRSYLDISNFSRYIYQGIDTNRVSSTKDYNSVASIMSGSFSEDLVSDVRNMNAEYTAYRNAGYSSWGKRESSATPNLDYITVPMSSQIMADAVRRSAGLANFDSKDDLIALNQDIFNFGIPMFTNDSVGFGIKDFASTGAIPEGSQRYNDLNNFMSPYRSNDNSFVGLAAYSLYSENPFYYYSWKLYHDGLGYTSSLYDVDGYKNLILSQADGGYFYMNDGNGGLKDFMDMKSLFTYIIPYMKECNDLVLEWDKTYGIYIHEGVPTEEGHWADVSGDPELTSKYWHNLNVSRLYGLYSPWVDIMYSCSYAKPATITVMGEKFVVKDPLNPASYPESRPMIFSEAEMKDYGLSEADLTPVERKILKCNEEMQERMYELLNYYNFSDITLNTAAAMQCAFAFNSTFSESGMLSENHNIYPQSYDLANFSYDAFLRFILAESTGEDLLNSAKLKGTHAGDTTGDFYERIINNSSTTTAIVMLVLDVLSIYVLPAFKMFFLVAIFISSILIILVSLCKIEDNAKFIRKLSAGFISPLICFFAVTVAFSVIVSWFMGTGNNSVTQTDKMSISLGDPVIVLLVMIALDLLVLMLYWKIIKNVVKTIKKDGKLALGFATGIFGAVGGLAIGSVSEASSSARSAVSGKNRYVNGTGVMSQRAMSRGNRNIDNFKERKRVIRGAKKPSIKYGSYTKKDSDAKRKTLDNQAKKGAENLKKDSKTSKTNVSNASKNNSRKSGMSYSPEKGYHYQD